MGNSQSSPIVSRTAGALDAFVSELGQDVLYDKSLGTSRFLKTVKCKHKNGYLVVKIYIKSDTNQLDEKHLRRLKKEKKALQDVPNVYSYQVFMESDKAGYLIRQWAASSLYDRISTRPFLSHIEKKWISFQMLVGLRDARKNKVSHGDIKSENILVTSWNWVYITDFASFKPTYLPLDNPSDFAYYYDTSGRRNCYIAPERFFTNERGVDGLKRDDGVRRDGKVTESMDVFSAGCVLAELFLEGSALFTLSQLFKYREGELDIDAHLGAIDDAPLRDLIKQMIRIDPSSRPTFDALLHLSRGSLFPECFYSTYHDFISSVNDLSVSSPFYNTWGGTSNGSPAAQGAQYRNSSWDEKPTLTDSDAELVPIPSDSDRRIARIWSEFDTVEPCFSSGSEDIEMTTVKIDYAIQYSSYKPLQNIIPVIAHMPNAQRRFTYASKTPNKDGPALIILSLICSNIRNCYLASSKLRTLDMLLILSTYLTDEAKLDRLLPYIVDLFHDDATLVRAAALRTALQILAFARAITPFNKDIFPQYILPNLRYTTNDPEVVVRSISAQSIVPFANLSVSFLEMGQALRAHGTLRLANGTQRFDESQFEISYDAHYEELQKLIEDQLSSLLVDQSSVVKRSVLLDIAPLCIFFGRQKTNDILLSHMITYLNDREWLLRYAFFDSIIDVATCLGGRNIEDYIFPLMAQALSDIEESNVSKVLSTLTTLSELGLFQKMRLWELMSSTLPLLYHPNSWIRQGAAMFIASASKALPKSDVWCILYPSLKHFLRSDIRLTDVRSILTALKSPLPRRIYDFAMDWAMKAGHSQFWRSQRKSSKFDSAKEVAIAQARKGARGAIRVTVKSEEDEIQLGKMEQLGMSAPEEAKLISLRDYIAKSAEILNSFRSRHRADNELDNLQSTGHVELQKLGVVPQTVFVGSRGGTSGSMRRISGGRPPSYRIASRDYSAEGTAYEDLRRRLATINGSSSSLNSTAQATRERGPYTLQRLPSAIPDLPLSVPMRPGSPTESIVSTVNSASMRPRFSVGSFEGTKAAPAVGSVRANATGLLENPGRSHADGESERSGWTSPTSFSTVAREKPGFVAYANNEDGQDAVLDAFLEHIHSDLSRESQIDFGPRVHEGPIRRRNITRQVAPLRDSKRRYLEATFIAHLQPHAAMINGLAVSPDHLFFVSCSDDRTVKVWDTARLERNVSSKPRHTYGGHHSAVRCVCMLEGYHCFASAADDGSLHVVRIHVYQSGSLPKYSKLQVVREHRLTRPGEYIKSMIHYNMDTVSILVYATNYSSICLMDLRSMRVLLSMDNPRHFGPVVSFCVDRKRNWLVAASFSGVLSLWDLRFGLLLRTWNVGSASPNHPVRVRQCVLHPSKGKGRWIMVSLDDTNVVQDRPGTVLIEVWNIETAVLVEQYIQRDAQQSAPSSTGTTSPLGPESAKGTATATAPQFLSATTAKHIEATAVESSPAAAVSALVHARQQGLLSPTSALVQPFSAVTVLLRASTSVSAMTAGVDFAGQGNAPRSFVDISLDMEQTVSSTGEPLTSSGSKAGYLVVGSEDCSVKLLDLEKFERSVVLVDREERRERTMFNNESISHENGATTTLLVETVWPPQTAPGAAAQRSSLINGHQAKLLKAHQDCVTVAACIDSPFRGGIVTGDRAGVIKVWRIDGVAESQQGALYS